MNPSHQFEQEIAPVSADKSVGYGLFLLCVSIGNDCFAAYMAMAVRTTLPDPSVSFPWGSVLT